MHWECHVSLSKARDLTVLNACRATIYKDRCYVKCGCCITLFEFSRFAIYRHATFNCFIVQISVVRSVIGKEFYGGSRIFGETSVVRINKINVLAAWCNEHPWQCLVMFLGEQFILQRKSLRGEMGMY